MATAVRARAVEMDSPVATAKADFFINESALIEALHLAPQFYYSKQSLIIVEVRK